MVNEFEGFEVEIVALWDNNETWRGGNTQKSKKTYQSSHFESWFGKIVGHADLLIRQTETLTSKDSD